MQNSWLQQLAEVAGTDIPTTLDRFMNNEALYKKFLLKFLRDTTFDNLRKTIEEGNFSSAFSYAHTLKGVSANLGLEFLYKKLTVITDHLRNRQTDQIGEEMEEIKEEYHRVCEFIRTL